jgi:hypothetical protein
MFLQTSQAAQKKLWQKADGHTQQQEDSCSGSVVIRGRAGDDMCNHVSSSMLIDSLRQRYSISNDEIIMSGLHHFFGHHLELVCC